MYHPGIDAIASMISMWPVKLISVTFFDLVIYFMANLKREPGAFFIFFLFTYSTLLVMSAIFRFVAAISKDEATAMSIAGVLLLALVIYTGCKSLSPTIHFLISRGLIKPRCYPESLNASLV
jgi:ATP-binding cassette, subfamily G (WHITE), member 2, PDR